MIMMNLIDFPPGACSSPFRSSEGWLGSRPDGKTISSKVQARLNQGKEKGHLITFTSDLCVDILNRRLYAKMSWENLFVVQSK